MLGDVWTSPSTGIEFVYIPPGEFEMGAPDREEYDDDEKPLHQVRITRGFWLGKYPVTQRQFESVMGKEENRSHFQGSDTPVRGYYTLPNETGYEWGDRVGYRETQYYQVEEGQFALIYNGSEHPVENVSWYDAREFLEWINARGEGRFRLPTEAEWEYVARAGSKLDRYAPDDELEEIAWYWENSYLETQPVGGKRPNTWGLYDMLGNVNEWCADWYASYAQGEQVNPTGPAHGTAKAIRGGSWETFPGGLRVSFRSPQRPDDRSDQCGFRCVREAD